MNDEIGSSLCNILLHVHLDGAVRSDTVFDFARDSGLSLSVETAKEFAKIYPVDEPTPLFEVLQRFHLVCGLVRGNPSRIRRITREFCEDLIPQRVLYCEVRYCPQLFRSENGSDLSTEDVVSLVSDEIRRFCFEHPDVTVKQLLCCLRNEDEYSEELLNLCSKFDDVVGLDLAGDDRIDDIPKTVAVFEEARRRGIRRTVHAGENSGAQQVRIAISQLGAERIGHGYHCLADSDVYALVRGSAVHLETCPYSSYLFGSVDVSQCWANHPIKRFYEDGVNFSINTDDPAFTGHTLLDDYNCVQQYMCLPTDVIRVSNVNAARSCFLPAQERKRVISRVESAHQ